jgi:hypothetical protein
MHVKDLTGNRYHKLLVIKEKEIMIYLWIYLIGLPIMFGFFLFFHKSYESDLALAICALIWPLAILIILGNLVPAGFARLFRRRK